MRTTFAGIFSNDMAGIQVYNIRTYGAKVDGVTDDSAAVTAAINAAKATSGGIIFFPRGTTKLGGQSSVIDLGATKRLKLRNCQNVSITNTANALIDADQAMPATASATALAPLGMTTHVTGTTTITSITATNFKTGDVLTLIFDSTAQISDGNNLVLNGNFTGGANRVLTLKYDGTNFVEQSRSAN